MIVSLAACSRVAGSLRKKNMARQYTFHIRMDISLVRTSLQFNMNIEYIWYGHLSNTFLQYIGISPIYKAKCERRTVYPAKCEFRTIEFPVQTWFSSNLYFITFPSIWTRKLLKLKERKLRRETRLLPDSHQTSFSSKTSFPSLMWVRLVL